MVSRVSDTVSDTPSRVSVYAIRSKADTVPGHAAARSQGVAPGMASLWPALSGEACQTEMCAGACPRRCGARRCVVSSPAPMLSSCMRSEATTYPLSVRRQEAAWSARGKAPRTSALGRKPRLACNSSPVATVQRTECLVPSMPSQLRDDAAERHNAASIGAHLRSQPKTSTAASAIRARTRPHASDVTWPTSRHPRATPAVPGHSASFHALDGPRVVSTAAPAKVDTHARARARNAGPVSPRCPRTRFQTTPVTLKPGEGLTPPTGLYATAVPTFQDERTGTLHPPKAQRLGPAPPSAAMVARRCAWGTPQRSEAPDA